MIRRILSLSVLFVSLGYAHAQNGMSITPGKIVKWFDSLGNLTDSVIYEDPGTGNVGVGTFSPNTNLSVEGDVPVFNGTGVGLFNRANGNTNRWVLGTGGAFVSPDGFSIGDSSAYRLIITGSGNVGIGTLNPLSKLHVVTDGVNQGVRAETDFQDAVVAISNNHIGVHGLTNSFFYPGVRATSYQGAAANLGLEVQGRFTATGTKNAIVPLEDGQQVLMAAEESTEVWFSDYGIAELANGVATVRIDRDFLQTVNSSKDYHVFVTPRGNPVGSVYIDNQTPSSFEIRETTGTANIKVSYKIVAKRKDFADERMKRAEWTQPSEPIMAVPQN